MEAFRVVVATAPFPEEDPLQPIFAPEGAEHSFVAKRLCLGGNEIVLHLFAVRPFPGFDGGVGHTAIADLGEEHRFLPFFAQGVDPFVVRLPAAQEFVEGRMVAIGQGVVGLNTDQVERIPEADAFVLFVEVGGVGELSGVHLPDFGDERPPVCFALDGGLVQFGADAEHIELFGFGQSGVMENKGFVVGEPRLPVFFALHGNIGAPFAEFASFAAQP